MLKVEGISKIFGRGSLNEKLALNNVNLTMQEGEFVTVIGGNGAGKSTLLNCIAGVYEVDSGKIHIDSNDVTFSPEYKRSKYMGRVFQDPMMGTAHDMTIAENLAIAYSKGETMNLRVGIKKKNIKLFQDRLARLELGLEDRIQQKVGLLSGGQRQALTLLMATIVKPKLLLLDEHIAALDPSIAKKVLKLTKEFVENDKLCTLMITHNMKAALDYGTRTIMMYEGEIILDIKGKERENMTVDGLISMFEKKSGEMLDNDRMLLG